MSRSSKPSVAVITGTGLTEHFKLAGRRKIRTKFGSATAYKSSDGLLWIVPRHGIGHVVPPHGVNYRANIAALHQIGVENVIATSAVGSMNEEFRIGEVGIVEQFVDFTKSRPSTFFERKAVHTDMTSPYSKEINSAIMKAGRALGLGVHPGLVYVCVEGPRFETAAEIRMFRILGGDVVGMTGVPEVVLANELGLKYSSVAIATNWAAGIQGRVSHDEVLGVMRKAGGNVRRLVEETVNLL